MCGPLFCVCFCIVGRPLESNCQSKYSQTHFIGFNLPPLACNMSCHLFRLRCTMGIGSEFVCTGVAEMISVSSTNASKPWSIWLFMSGEVTTHGVTIDWYAEIKLSTWTTQCGAALPRPCPAPYQGDSAVNWLYVVDMPWACFKWYWNNQCAFAWNLRYCRSAPCCRQDRFWHASTIRSKHWAISLLTSAAVVLVMQKWS